MVPLLRIVCFASRGNYLALLVYDKACAARFDAFTPSYQVELSDPEPAAALLREAAVMAKLALS